MADNNSVPLFATASKLHCIFCAKEYPQGFTHENGKLINTKESELNSFECENELLAKQLRAFNIVKNILDVKNEICQNLLCYKYGQLHPEFWVKVCASCKVFVEEYNFTRMEIAKLEKKAKNVKNKLKLLIHESNQNTNVKVQMSVYHSRWIEFANWKVIRNEALRGFEVPPIYSAVPEQAQNAGEMNISMIVEAEPEFRVKMELHEPVSEERCLARVTQPEHVAKPKLKSKTRQDADIGCGQTKKKAKLVRENNERVGHCETSITTNSEGAAEISPAIASSSRKSQQILNQQMTRTVPTPKASKNTKKPKVQTVKARTIKEICRNWNFRAPPLRPRCTPEPSLAMLRKEFFFGKNKYDYVPPGFTKVKIPDSEIVYDCDFCPAKKLKRDVVFGHQYAHSHYEKGEISVCSDCGIFVFNHSMIEHREKQCLKNANDMGIEVHLSI